MNGTIKRTSMENNWLDKPEQNHNLLSMISELNERGMYYNITKPKSWSGQPLDIPHWSDNLERKPSTYANFPKLWGDPKEAGTRFWNEPAEGESNMIKDTFGFGTEKKPKQSSDIDDLVKDAYKVDKHEHLENLLEADISEKEYVDAAIRFERKNLKDFLTRKFTSSDEQKAVAEERLNKNYDELYNVFSEAYQNARKGRLENTNVLKRFADKQSIRPYHNIWSGEKEIGIR